MNVADRLDEIQRRHGDVAEMATVMGLTMAAAGLLSGLLFGFVWLWNVTAWWVPMSPVAFVVARFLRWFFLSSDGSEPQ